MREVFRALAWSVYAPSLVLAMGQQAAYVLLPLYVLNTGGTTAEAGLVVAASGLGSLSSNLPAGLWVSRFGDQRVMLASCICMAIACLCLATFDHGFAMSLSAFVFGASNGAWMLARLAFMTEAIAPAKRGRGIALMGGVMRLGGFVGPALGGALVVVTSFAVAFVVTALLALITASMLMLLTRNFVAPAAVGVPIGVDSLQQVMRQHRQVYGTAGLAVVTIALVRSAYALLIPLWGTQIGLNPAEIGLIFSALSAIDMLMFYPVGIVVDRWGRKWAAIPCLLFMALSLLLLPATTSFFALALVAMLCGFGNGFGSGIVMILGSDFAPAQHRGEFLGGWRMLADVGHIGAPFLTSVLSVAGGLLAACWAAAAVGVLGAFIMGYLVPETLPQKKAEKVEQKVT